MVVVGQSEQRTTNVGEKEVHARPLGGERIYKWNREGLKRCWAAQRGRLPVLAKCRALRWPVARDVIWRDISAQRSLYEVVDTGRPEAGHLPFPSLLLL
jgi:hypothetical protein